MDLRKIEYFLAVVQYGNISSAAEALRVSQPTLSRQVRSLEQEFKTPLLVRHGRGVVPTEAGQRLHEGLRSLERQIRSLRDDVKAAAREPSGEVALGIPPSPRTLLATAILRRFCETYPSVSVRIAEDTSGGIRDLLAKGDLDLAIVNSEEPLQLLVADALATEPMLLVGPPQAELSLTVPTRIEQLASLPLILTTHPNSLRRMVELRLQQTGRRPNVRLQANTLPLMTDLVAQGLGYTVLPSCSVVARVGRGELSASPLEGLRITWMVARPAHRSLSVAGRLMLETITETVRALIRDGSWALAQAERERRADARRRSREG